MSLQLINQQQPGDKQAAKFTYDDSGTFQIELEYLTEVQL